MAESNNSTSDGGSWWGGWLQAAKEKSMSAIEMIKKDLEEFSTTMQNDTGEAVAKTSESLRETLKTENTEAARDKLKQGISSFLDGLTKLLVVEAEDKNEPVTTRKTTDPIFDRAKARLHAIQVDPSTYCNKPTGAIERFEEWLKSFDMESKKGEISELLVSQVEVRGLYTRLVPSEISHADFWRRYFYKVHQLQIDEARKLALMKRAEQSEKKEDSINWDDLDSSGDEEDKKPEKTSKTDKPVVKSQQTEKAKQEKSKQTEKAKQEKSVPATENTADTKTDKTETAQSKLDQKPHIDDSSNGTGNDESENSPQKDKFNESCTNCEVQDGKDSMSDKNEVVNKEAKETNKSGSLKDELNSCKDVQSNSESDINMSKESGEKETKQSVVTSDDQKDYENIKANEVNPSQTGDDENLEIRTKEKGDVVVVNPDRDSPSTESTKESADDDWERDFDVELTEEDLKAADEIAKKLNISSADYTKLSPELEDDWESWE